jgi:hypothetical protein
MMSTEEGAGEEVGDLQNVAGFFDLAIAAPSMKASLEAWGADSNLFHQGAAKQSQDSDVVAATMAKLGVVLRRPVGSNGRFSEHPELPTDLGDADKPAKSARKSERRKPKKTASRQVDMAAERKAAVAYEREQKNRERERAREEAARQKERERRQQAVDKAKAAFDKAAGEHAKRAAAIQVEIDALEKKARADDADWDKERGRLEAALRRARD